MPFDPNSLVGKLTPDGSLQLLEIIGSGSFSVVCRAMHVTSGAEYAVKCLFKFNLNPQQLAIQRQEATILSQLPPHPNVIQLENVIESPSVLFLVFPYLPSDLFDVIMNASSEKGGGLSDKSIRDMMVQICLAVKHCHDHGIYHRDIKPENILVDTDPSGRHVMKLADFGLATTQSYSNDLGVGSLRYQSPQALRSASCKPTPDSSLGGVVSISSSRIGYNDSGQYNSVLRRLNTNDVCLSPSPMGYWTKLNDVWALGVVLINLITGRNPWAIASASDSTYAAFISHDKDILSREFSLSHDTAAIIRGVFESDEDCRLSLKEFIQAVNATSKFTHKTILDKSYTVFSSEVNVDYEDVPDLALSSYTPPPYISPLISSTRLPNPVAISNPIKITAPISSSSQSSFSPTASKTPKAGIMAARSYQKSWSSDVDEMDWENGIPDFDNSGVVVEKIIGFSGVEADKNVSDPDVDENVHDYQSNNGNEAGLRSSEEELLYQVNAD